MLDSFSDDWRATVDRHPATLVRANGLFRAVRLNPGRHIVEFLYRPRAFLAGAAVSAAALFMVLGLLVLPVTARRSCVRSSPALAVAGVDVVLRRMRSAADPGTQLTSPRRL